VYVKTGRDTTKNEIERSREKKERKKERKVRGWMDGWTGRSGNSETDLHNFPPMCRAIFIKIRQGL
jgi:hypothetical protein